MGLFNYKTSNPAFTPYFWKDNSRSHLKMTVRGILIKSLISILIIAFITGQSPTDSQKIDFLHVKTDFSTTKIENTPQNGYFPVGHAIFCMYQGWFTFGKA